MVKTATRSVELEPIDRLEEKVKRLVGMVDRMRDEQARAAEENQRLRMYKRIAGVETESQSSDVRAELQDRYGEPPPAVRNLLEYATLKLLAVRVGATGIERKRDVVTIKFRQNAVIDPAKLAQFVSSQRGTQFSPDGMLKFSLNASAAQEVLRRLRSILEQLAGEVPQEAPAQTT